MVLIDDRYPCIELERLVGRAAIQPHVVSLLLTNIEDAIAHYGQDLSQDECTILRQAVQRWQRLHQHPSLELLSAVLSVMCAWHVRRNAAGDRTQRLRRTTLCSW